MPHSLTVLRSLGPLMAKTWRPDGTITHYDDAAQFTVSSLPCSNLKELHDSIVKLSIDPRSCFIRGRSIKPLQPGERTLRRLTHFEDQPHVILNLDVDGYTVQSCDPLTDPAAAVREWVQTQLPEAMRYSGYVWQLSGQMGHPSQPPRRLRCHVYMLLAKPLTCAELEAWSREYLPRVDSTVHRTVQVNYTSSPIILAGAGPDPYSGRRVGIERGLVSDYLHIPESMPIKAPALSSSGTARRQMIDPRDKSGVIGALCRTIRCTQLPSLFPDVFAPGSKPERITWLAGGGTPEGVRVTDDGLHLYNSHHTAPLQHAAHLFDFVAAHVYGHLDAELDPDARAWGGTALPSYQATLTWALGLPEVQAELAIERAQRAAGPGRAAPPAGDSTPASASTDLAPADSPEVASEVLDDPDPRRVRMARLRRHIEKVASVVDLETELCPRIAPMDLSDTERAELVSLVRTRTQELMPPKGMAESIVKRWLARPKRQALVQLPHLGPEGNALMTRENVAAVLAARDWVLRYNVITKTIEAVGPGLPEAGDDLANTAMTWIMSACAEALLPVYAGHIRSYAAALAFANEYNPVAQWVRSRDWDGQDRIGALADTFECSPEFELAHPGLKALVLRKWLIQAVALALSPRPLQGRGVLVFVGAQYIGKSRWLQRLAPEADAGARLVRTGHLLEPHNKDSVKLAVSRWITELGELDGTMRKADQAAIKAFLSQDVDELRLPYAPSEVRYQRRTAFAASVNEDEFLVDATGASRFWCLPVVRIDPDHRVDMQQVWAQAETLWMAGEPHVFTMPEMERVTEAADEHQVTDPYVAMVLDLFDVPPLGAMPGRADEILTVAPVTDGQVWTAMHPAQVVTKLGVKAPGRVEATRMGRALQKLGLPKAPRTLAGNRRWVPPLRRGVCFEPDSAS